MSELYHLWVQNQDGAEYCENVLLNGVETAEQIRQRLDEDGRVFDYTLEREKSTVPLTTDEAMEDVETFLAWISA